MVGVFSPIPGVGGLLALTAGSLTAVAVGRGLGVAERVGAYPAIVWAVVLENPRLRSPEL